MKRIKLSNGDRLLILEPKDLTKRSVGVDTLKDSLKYSIEPLKTADHVIRFDYTNKKNPFKLVMSRRYAV